GQGADEAVDDLSVAQGVDRRDRLHLERGRHARVLVDVHVHQLDAALRGVDHALDGRPERAARAAPRGPQVDHDRHLLRALEDVAFEGLVGDVDHRLVQLPRRSRDSLRNYVEAMTAIEGIDVDAVTRWYEANVDGVTPPLTFTLVAGGRSNLTYKVTDAAGET